MFVQSVMFIASTMLLTDALKAEQTFEPTRKVFRRVYEQASEVLVLGDTDHNDSSIARAAGLSLKDIRSVDSGFNCLVTEIDQRLQPFLEEYTASKDVGLATMIVKKAPNFGHDQLLEHQLMSLQVSLYESAKNAGMKILAGDVDFSLRDQELPRISYAWRANPQDIKVIQSYAEKLVNGRSLLFAQKIARQLRRNGGPCSKVVLFVGKGHLLPSFQGVKVTPVQDHLKRMNILSTISLVVPAVCELKPVAQRPACAAVASRFDVESTGGVSDEQTQKAFGARFLIYSYSQPSDRKQIY